MNLCYPFHCPYENTRKESRVTTFGIQSSQVREPLGTSRMEDESWRQDVIEMIKEAHVILQDFRRETKVLFEELREKSKDIVAAVHSKGNQYSGELHSTSLLNSSVETPVELMVDEVLVESEGTKVFDKMSESNHDEEFNELAVDITQNEEVMSSDGLIVKVEI